MKVLWSHPADVWCQELTEIGVQAHATEYPAYLSTKFQMEVRAIRVHQRFEILVNNLHKIRVSNICSKEQRRIYILATQLVL